MAGDDDSVMGDPSVRYGARTIGENDRAQRSIIDPMPMRTALEDRDADLTARLAREHTLGWAAPMEKNATYLDEGQLTSALG